LVTQSGSRRRVEVRALWITPAARGDTDYRRHALGLVGDLEAAGARLEAEEMTCAQEERLRLGRLSLRSGPNLSSQPGQAAGTS
jgi:hypothetical protein